MELKRLAHGDLVYCGNCRPSVKDFNGSDRSFETRTLNIVQWQEFNIDIFKRSTEKIDHCKRIA